MQTYVQVKNVSDGLRMLFRTLLTARTDCMPPPCPCSSDPLAVLVARGTAHTACLRRSGCSWSSFLSGCTPRAGHGPHCLPPSVWLHSKLIPLCKPCAMGMIIWTLSWAPVQFLRHRWNIVGGISFPKGRDSAASSSLYLYLQRLYDSVTAHTLDTVSLCSSHQTRPRMAASVCLAPLQVPSLVVGIFVLDTISWNALQDTQLCN